MNECAEGTGMDCDEVLAQVYEYLDGELDNASVALVKKHLDACSPCLREVGLEESVKKLVARSCGCLSAPDHLRVQVLQRITSIRVSRGQAAEVE